jgi:hypothetical protein
VLAKRIDNILPLALPYAVDDALSHWLQAFLERLMRDSQPAFQVLEGVVHCVIVQLLIYKAGFKRGIQVIGYSLLRLSQDFVDVLAMHQMFFLSIADVISASDPDTSQNMTSPF